MATSPRVVLIHDWLTGMRGGEKCLEEAARRWPDARLFTLLHKRGSVSPAIERLRIRTSFLDHLPGARRHYRYLLPLMPRAIEGLPLPRADLIVSFSHCVAKAARPHSSQAGRVPHVCYCFTPMRYAWQLRQAYFGGRLPGVAARVLDGVLDRLRDWDRRTAANVTHFVAISRTIQARIRECYGRESTVVYPPVDTDFYTPAAVPRGDHYLVVSAFAPYKRLDLAVQACARLGRRLVVIGTGQDERRLRSQATGDVTFLGWQSDEVIRDQMRRCRALLFPGEEDFGIVPVEAMACGTPVVAFGSGGCTETVVPLGGRAGPTGVWFGEQTAEALADAVRRLEERRADFDPAAARRQAQRFSRRRYREGLFAAVQSALHRAREPRVAA